MENGRYKKSADMTATLYDSISALPNDLGDHIIVFTGYATNDRGENTGIVTEVTCRYHVGGQQVVFARNADNTSQRFEDALGWAVRQAPVYGVSDVHAVFELNRPIDSRFLNKICPDGLRDCRRDARQPCEATAPRLRTVSPIGRVDGAALAIRRRLVFRNRKNAIKPARTFVNAT